MRHGPALFCAEVRLRDGTESVRALWQRLAYQELRRCGLSSSGSSCASTCRAATSSVMELATAIVSHLRQSRAHSIPTAVPTTAAESHRSDAPGAFVASAPLQFGKVCFAAVPGVGASCIGPDDTRSYILRNGPVRRSARVAENHRLWSQRRQLSTERGLRNPNHDAPAQPGLAVCFAATPAVRAPIRCWSASRWRQRRPGLYAQR